MPYLERQGRLEGDAVIDPRLEQARARALVRQVRAIHESTGPVPACVVVDILSLADRLGCAAMVRRVVRAMVARRAMRLGGAS